MTPPMTIPNMHMEAPPNLAQKFLFLRNPPPEGRQQGRAYDPGHRWQNEEERLEVEGEVALRDHDPPYLALSQTGDTGHSSQFISSTSTSAKSLSPSLVMCSRMDPRFPVGTATTRPNG